MELKNCPFCGGEMEYFEESHKNKNGRTITEKYYMHKEETDCILDDLMQPFTIGAGDRTENYIGEYAEKWNERAFDPKEGEWIPLYGKYDAAQCSLCHEVYEVSEDDCRALFTEFCRNYRFCPYCGARMKAKAE